ncbi:hypothetical protein [Ramlibacter pallidus]|uniref:Uncharacterized protein n=1 Tax=Ramlibacter pallidus TaxID=2780087 RepID=A0ABR9S438_9BURK|nr:hypothetical protein [Ramlibacter pallidus]MBE7368062.1 hypothetical protein [Ramlibacter pallidus]
MRHSPSAQQRARLLPEGRRWGFGAHSVMPYLSALHVRPGEGQGPVDIRNPVFPEMENALRDLIRRH